MAEEPEHPPTFSTARRLGIGFHVFISCVALFAIVVMVNYLGARYYKRSNWSPADRLTLAPLTKQLLASLTNEVNVTVFFNTEEPLYEPVTLLLNEFRHESRKLNIRTIDYMNNPIGARQFMSKYKLPPSEQNFVMFESGGRSKPVGASELSTYDTSNLIAGKSREVKRTEFKGEMMFTSALYGVIAGSQPKAYFLQGHRELDPADARGENGFGQFAELLSLNNVAHTTLALTGTNDVPSDCQLLIIAGAASKLDPRELDKVDKFLTQGGRMLVFYRDFPGSGEINLESLLYRWGVATGDDWVRDPNNVVGGSGMLITNYGPHAITRSLDKEKLPLLLMLPRSVAKRADMPLKAEAPDVTPLLLTSDSGVAHTQFKDGLAYPDPKRDGHGVLPVAVAVEKGALPGVKLERGTTRIVVVGDVLFLNNLQINTLANRHFGEKSVNWLLDRTAFLKDVGPTPVREYKLVMTPSQMWTVWGIFLLVMPGSVLTLGLLVWWRRRH